jgi:hypothetical protein
MADEKGEDERTVEFAVSSDDSASSDDSDPDVVDPKTGYTMSADVQAMITLLQSNETKADVLTKEVDYHAHVEKTTGDTPVIPPLQHDANSILVSEAPEGEQELLDLEGIQFLERTRRLTNVFGVRLVRRRCCGGCCKYSLQLVDEVR